jgi:hypothetical protein
MRPYQAAVNRRKIGHARLRHRHHKLSLKNFEHPLYARWPVGSKTPPDRAAKTNGFGAQRESLEDVRAASDTAIEQHRYTCWDGIDDLGQYF